MSRNGNPREVIVRAQEGCGASGALAPAWHLGAFTSEQSCARNDMCISYTFTDRCVPFARACRRAFLESGSTSARRRSEAPESASHHSGRTMTP